MKFKVSKKCRNSKARSGILFGAERLPDVEIETPLLMFYTKGGSIPHITHEVLQLISTENHAIQVPLVSTVQFYQPLNLWERPLADFIGFTEYLTCVTVQDPGDFTPSGKHKNDSIPIWTRSGKIDITAEKYMDMVEAFKPDIYYTLSDGDTNVSSPKKRTQKSVDRTIQFFQKCVQRHLKSDVLKNKMLLAAISGGYNINERQRCVKNLINDEYNQIISGYLIDGLHNNGPELELINFDSDVLPVVEKTIEILPEEKLRAVHGCWNPLSIIRLVKLGVDVFDTSFPYIVTERSAALTFNYTISENNGTLPNEKFEINLRDSSHRESLIPLYVHCECLACKKHTRSYIYHLLNVQELLGSVLLTIHNLHHYIYFFKQIRKAINDGQLENLENWIRRQYEQYTNSLLERKQITDDDQHQPSPFNDEGDTSLNYRE